MAIVRNDKLYRYLKADGSSIWFRYSIDANGAYQFIFQTGTAGGDQTLVTSQAAFQNQNGYPGATTTTGNVLDPALMTVGFPDGTAANPGIFFNAEPATGFYRVGSGAVMYSSNGSNSLQFQSGGKISGANSSSQFIYMPSAGGVQLQAAGTNQNITLTPSGTGWVEIDGANNSTILQLNNNSQNGGITISRTGTNPGSTNWQVTSNGGSTLTAGSDISMGPTAVNNVFTIVAASAVANTLYLKGGRALIGTTTDSGALLQIGTNTTTLAGGMIFGTDTAIYRISGGELRFDHIGGTTPVLMLAEGSVNKGYLGTTSGILQLYTVGATSLTIGTNNTTALTVDGSQNATFAKNLDAALFRSTLYQVSTLPAAATANKGYRATVSDANSTIFNSVVAGGGANLVPVYSDGTNWRIG